MAPTPTNRSVDRSLRASCSIQAAHRQMRWQSQSACSSVAPPNATTESPNHVHSKKNFAGESKRGEGTCRAGGGQMAQCAPLIAPYAAAPGKESRTQCPAPWNLRATAPRVAPCRWAHQDERRPALEPDAAHEREAARAIAGERSIGLCGEQARQH